MVEIEDVMVSVFWSQVFSELGKALYLDEKQELYITPKGRIRRRFIEDYSEYFKNIEENGYSESYMKLVEYSQIKELRARALLDVIEHGVKAGELGSYGNYLVLDRAARLLRDYKHGEVSN